MSGHYAIVKENENVTAIYGDTSLLKNFQSEGWHVEHLGFGDFRITQHNNKPICVQIDFIRYSDTKQMKDQVGRCHRLRFRGGELNIASFVFPKDSTETEFSEDEEVYNKWKVDIK